MAEVPWQDRGQKLGETHDSKAGKAGGIVSIVVQLKQHTVIYDDLPANFLVDEKYEGYLDCVTTDNAVIIRFNEPVTEDIPWCNLLIEERPAKKAA